MEKIFCRKYFIFYVLLLLTVVSSKPVHGQGTAVGFYGSTCPQVESIVKSTVQTHFQLNPRIAPGLLRMHFHDCFVRGCDASVLINGDSAERTAPANQLLKGFDVIDDAKAQLEALCPGVVSCADILALAARDAVTLTNGPHWEVPTGRRDGLTSLASETSNLPSFGDTVDVQKSKFAQKGLETVDLVTLVGAHTIGTAACFTFSNRLYNFPSTGNGVDPSIDPSFLPQLQTLCPQNGDSTRRVELDIGSVDNFDTSYFQNLRNGRGVLESDQRLWADPSTRTVAENYLGRATGSDESKFYNAFVESMIKMSNIGILTGSEGEIRKVCSAFN